MPQPAPTGSAVDLLAEGTAAFDAGRADDALALAEAGLRVAQTDRERFDLQRLATVVLHRLGRLRQAYELAEDLLPLSPAVSQAAVADVAAILGAIADQLGDPGLALERTGLALETLAAAGTDDDSYLRATHDIASSLLRFGAHRLAAEMLNVGREICPADDQLRPAIDITLATAEVRLAARYTIDPDERRQRYERALALTQPHLHRSGPSGRVEAATITAHALLGLGDTTAAQRLLDATSESAVMITDPVIITGYELARARTYRTRHELHGARIAADRAVIGAELADDPMLAAAARYERSRVAEDQGEVHRALADLREAVKLQRARQTGRYDSLMRQVQHRAALRTARHDAEARAAALAQSVITLRRLVSHDHLTNLPNRRAFDLDAPLASGVAGVVMADIDHFKAINDSRGHLIGDAALQLTARTITRCLGERGTAYRWGGEEFLVVLADEYVEQAGEVADELRAAIADAPWFSVAPGLVVTMSVGVAAGPADSLRTLVAQADQALYRAKAAGRDQVAIAPD